MNEELREERYLSGIEDCGDAYAILDELRAELIAASCEPAGDTQEGRDEVRRLYDDIERVERVKLLITEIVDPNRR